MIDWNEFNDIVDPNNVFSSQDLYIFVKNQGSTSIELNLIIQRISFNKSIEIIDSNHLNTIEISFEVEYIIEKLN